ncbi:hypothetical protein D3C84_848610 [compost metagenome]
MASRERVADSALRAGSLAACGEGAITRQSRAGEGTPQPDYQQAKRAEAKPGTAKDRNSRTPRGLQGAWPGGSAETGGVRPNASLRSLLAISQRLAGEAGQPSSDGSPWICFTPCAAGPTIGAANV